MKKLVFFVMIAVLIVSLCACSQQDLADMTSGTDNGVSTIAWGDKIYVPHGPLATYGDCGKQIRIIDGDKDGYSAAWIRTLTRCWE